MKNIKESNKIKIAYIGGGSRGWAWGLMSDLVTGGSDIGGEVHLYDIDYKLAKNNETIGNTVQGSNFVYKAAPTIGDALTGADFVIISILPGTFKEMHSDVHTPEQYGIYQPVGDTTGPGGLVRAIRTVPMFVEIAQAIEKYSPEAWVINYTNPMAMCVDTLYRVFPKIKAFGCCHEVFGTQKMLVRALIEIKGMEKVDRSEIKVNVQGINHFTWLNKATYKNMDIFPVYEEFVKRYSETGYIDPTDKKHWANGEFTKKEMVKMDLFKRFGCIAAAGDRHLAEFCPGYWYLKSPEDVKRWGFELTTVDSRIQGWQKKLERSERLVSGEDKFEIKETGEEGVKQIRAIMGLEDLVTNVNLPNIGQLSDMPLGYVVETNAHFTSDSVRPVMAGNMHPQVNALVNRVAQNHHRTVQSCLNKDIEGVFEAFINDPLVTISPDKAYELFTKMVKNNDEYHGFYK